MLLDTIAAASDAIAATSSRTVKRGLLAETIQAADSSEAALVAGYLSGSLRQRRTGLGWAGLSDLPPPAAQPSLTVAEVDSAFEAIAAAGGSGAAGRRSAAARALFARATAREQAFLRALAVGELHQGAMDALVQDALAQAHGVPAPSVRRAAMLLGSTPDAAELLATAGLAGLDGVTLTVGRAVSPMLAAAAPDAAAAVTRTGLPAVVDAKLDGIRVQVHCGADGIHVFTRSLEEITERVPEVVAAVSALRASDLVLDGELIAVGPGGRPLPFQVISARTASSSDVAAARSETPLSLFCFDVLHAGGTDLLDAPLAERLARLTGLAPPEMIVPRRTATSVDQVAGLFAEAVAAGYEGVVVKNPTGTYAAGRRDANWVKLKPRHTFDLAVTAAEWGHGRRAGRLSNLHLAARDEATGELVMLGKTFKGLTDEMLAWQTEQILAREVCRTRGTVHPDPPLVAEVACDGIQVSSRYPGGIALRFARVVRYRPDKGSDDVDTLDTVRALGRTPDR